MTVGRPMPWFLGVYVDDFNAGHVDALKVGGHGSEIAFLLLEVEVGFGRHLGQVLAVVSDRSL